MMNKIYQRRGLLILITAVIAVCMAVSIAGCKKKSPEPGPNEVWIIGWTYIPDTITVADGTTITWKNTTLEFHQVNSDTGLFTGLLDSGATFTYTFTSPGTYDYHDESTDPPAIGKVIVK
jgi:plastocyanin